MLRILMRCLLLALGMIFLGLSVLLLLSGQQIRKNRLELADMQDRVAAVEKFELKNNRPPSKEEFQSVIAGLPVRYSVNYKFAPTPADCQITVPGGWPKTTGWVIYYWRGEWYEYYTSWDKHYTLAQEATWWGFCGQVLFSPVVAGMFIGLSFLPSFRRKKLCPTPGATAMGL
jgi:hypothetical protein